MTFIQAIVAIILLGIFGVLIYPMIHEEWRYQRWKHSHARRRTGGS
jgi:uncharacterized membrane protein YadS